MCLLIIAADGPCYRFCVLTAGYLERGHAMLQSRSGPKLAPAADTPGAAIAAASEPPRLSGNSHLGSNRAQARPRPQTQGQGHGTAGSGSQQVPSVNETGCHLPRSDYSDAPPAKRAKVAQSDDRTEEAGGEGPAAETSGHPGMPVVDLVESLLGRLTSDRSASPRQTAEELMAAVASSACPAGCVAIALETAFQECAHTGGLDAVCLDAVSDMVATSGGTRRTVGLDEGGRAEEVAFVAAWCSPCSLARETFLRLLQCTAALRELAASSFSTGYGWIISVSHCIQLYRR